MVVRLVCIPKHFLSKLTLYFKLEHFVIVNIYFIVLKWSGLQEEWVLRGLAHGAVFTSLIF
jgi:hypothetical protein